MPYFALIREDNGEDAADLKIFRHIEAQEYTVSRLVV